MLALNELKSPKAEVAVSSRSMTLPLPSPPPGLTWRRNPDKSWTLLHDDTFASSSLLLTAPTSLEREGIYHEVLSTDTMAGICIQYNTNAQNIRRLNNISGDSIHSLKLIRILAPVECKNADKDLGKEKSANMLERGEQEQKRMLIREFIEETCGKEGKEEAEFYLSNRNWRIELALSDWKNDDEAASA